MAYAYGKGVGEEARYRNKNVMLGPGVNIYRTPLNGRNFEYMGEDPYLAATLVVPYIKGVQSNSQLCEALLCEQPRDEPHGCERRGERACFA